MSELASIEKDRKTIRAAMVVVPMNPVARTLILDLVDRIFDRELRREERLLKLENRNATD